MSAVEVCPSNPFNPAGPLLFAYSFPVRSLDRHREAWGTWTRSLLGLGAAAVEARCRQHWLGAAHPDLQPFVDFLGTLDPCQLRIEDPESAVGLSPREEREKREEEELARQYAGDAKGYTNALTKRMIEKMTGGGQVPEEPDDETFYQQAYQQKLEEWATLPSPLEPIGGTCSLLLRHLDSPWGIVIEDYGSEPVPLEELHPDFPWEQHPVLRSFLTLFPGLEIVHGSNADHMGFVANRPLDVVSKSGPIDWGNFEPKWDQSLSVYAVCNGDAIVCSREGKIGYFSHDIGWETDDSSIKELEVAGFQGVVDEFIRLATDPERYRDSFLW